MQNAQPVGAKFPAKYQQALNINDWRYGKMYAVHLEPAGASYTATFETFVSGKPLPLTDVCINRDGAMYFTIGGRGTQSGLYRVTYVGKESTAAQSPPANPVAEKARAIRPLASNRLEIPLFDQLPDQSLDLTQRAMREPAIVGRAVIAELPHLLHVPVRDA